MVPMAPWDLNHPGRITDLRFTTVRCLDLSPGGLAIVLPRLPTAWGPDWSTTRYSATISTY